MKHESPRPLVTAITGQQPTAAEIPTRVSWDQWDPGAYLREFYAGPSIVADELEAVRSQINFYRLGIGVGLVLEFGCGPTVHRSIVAANYASEIHMVDYLPSNLEEVRKWIDGDSNAHDWRTFCVYILQLEGEDPTEEAIAKREALTRSKINRLMHGDAGKENPLGVCFRGLYDHVYSGFCADSATDDKKTWERYVRNISSLIKPGGTFWTGALRKTQYYRSGDQYFPSAGIDENDFMRVLPFDFLPESITIKVRDLPELKEHGYEGIVLATATKR